MVIYTKDIMYGKICEVTSRIEYLKFDIDNINKFLINFKINLIINIF